MAILYAMAAEAEYGSCLRSRISPLYIGVGPVEAAIALTRALSMAEAAGALPELVVSLGSAGSRRLAQGDVYVASSVSYRDMDATALGFELGVTPFLDLPPIIELPLTVPGVSTASLSTGANVVSGGRYASIEADMVDMETFAVVRACDSFGVPVIAVRGISDGAEELHQYEDWTRYLHVVDERLANVVDRIEEAYKEGRLP
ncbi:5'-methylthioadenosine/S-adenosylhomocysteine nucleosidase [Devosia pacifica]|uniref:5'-methylthioadenosine/S-adenosylhomocysteine nucleosidase n=1 Tax=Devosia pacifica TaxID=1335967 RepID=A0A918VNF1_9HYPH|nr:5'-methylthioadenosine/S-adenosylhomocysteine nucleosidase [Devosia pacifica]GHA12399.1 5'-methylthioadenosine/S-adenosylhomocysteine nucleosidase [Devosia pacifica]